LNDAVMGSACAPTRRWNVQAAAAMMLLFPVVLLFLLFPRARGVDALCGDPAIAIVAELGDPDATAELILLTNPSAGLSVRC
jgi:hypothetical protein